MEIPEREIPDLDRSLAVDSVQDRPTEGGLIHARPIHERSVQDPVDVTCPVTARIVRADGLHQVHELAVVVDQE